MNYKTVFKDFKSLKAEVDSSEVKLQKLGYINLQKSDLLKKNDSTYSVSFELKTKYEKIRLFFPDNFEQLGLTQKDFQKFSMESSHTYFTVDFKQIEFTLNTLNHKISEMGFPFTYLQLKELKPTLDTIPTIEAQLVIVTDTKRKITEIEIKGYEKFPTSFLKYTLGIKRGMLFQKQKITEKSNLLQNLGFAKNTKAPEVLFTNEETNSMNVLYRRQDGKLGWIAPEQA